MKKILFIIVILFSISIISFPQKTKPKYNEIKKVGNLKKVRLNNLWGVLNQEDKIIIPIQFKDIQLSECGLIAAKLTHNFAVFNTTGEQLSEFSYPKIHQMEDSVAKVEKDGKIGYINYWGSKTGEIYEYQSGYFVNGFVRVKKRDKNGFTTKIGYLNKYLKQITEIKYSSESSDFYCSRAKICVAKEVKEQDYMYGYTITKHGFINEDGEEIIKPIWDDAKDFSYGLARVYKITGDSAKYGFINTDGELITDINFDDPEYFRDINYDFENKLVPVIVNNKYGFINSSGKEIIACQFSVAESFRGDLSRICLGGDIVGGSVIGGKWGYINQQGEIIVKPIYSYIEHFKNGIAKANKNGILYANGVNSGKWGLVNHKGNEITDFIYDKIEDINNGVVHVNIGKSFDNEGKWGLVDSTGKEITTIKYDWIGSPVNGFNKVSISNLYGYIDANGKELSEIKFQSASDFNNDTANVIMDGIEYTLTSKGKLIPKRK